MPEPTRPDVGACDELAPRPPEPATTFHGDPFPPYCCENCESHRRESLALTARARLLRQAVHDRDDVLTAHHATELLGMLEARGMA